MHAAAKEQKIKQFSNFLICEKPKALFFGRFRFRAAGKQIGCMLAWAQVPAGRPRARRCSYLQRTLIADDE
jgi:hypothetical protein